MVLYRQLNKCISGFSQLSFPAQVLAVSTCWLFIIFTVDCWVSPFYLRGYRLATLLSAVFLLAVFVTGWVVDLVFQKNEPFELKLVERKKVRADRGPANILALFEGEIQAWVDDIINLVVKTWYSEISDDQEFLEELQSQLGDILIVLAKKLVTISSRDIAQNLIQLLRHHLQSYYVAKKNSKLQDDIERHFRFQHPVMKGEYSLEQYLSSTSKQLLLNIIPGSIQDCEAVFHVICCVFAHRVLWNLIEALAKPETVLELLLNIISPVKQDSFTEQLTSQETPMSFKHLRATEEQETLSKNHFTKDQYAKSSSISNDEPDVKHTKPCLLPLEPVAVEVDSVQNQTTPKGLSPVYEEVEDFASAIARLRSLLEQRNSQQSLNSTGSESESLKGKLNSPSVHGRLLSETESSFEDLAETFMESPMDGKVFSNIFIPEADLCTQSGDFIYCIVYDAVYAAAGTDISASLPESLDNDISVALEARETRYVLKKRTVKRKFSEFLQFHAQLTASQNPVVRNEARNLRGPSKWLNLPFSRSDQSTVMYGRRYLERYLQQVSSCASLCSAPELRNFLDYEFTSGFGDPESLASSLGNQRLDRLLVKTVSGVLQSIRTALPIPGADNEAAAPAQLVPLPLMPICVSAADCKVFKGSSGGLMGQESNLKCPITFAADDSRIAFLLDSYISVLDFRVDSAYEALEVSPKAGESNSSQPLLNSVQQCPENELPEDWYRFDEILPLSSTAINLMVEILGNHETLLNKSSVTFMLKIFFGRPLENFVQNGLDELTDPKIILKKLKEFRQSFWNDSDALVSGSNSESGDQELLKRKLAFQSKEALPGCLLYLLGQDNCSAAIDNILSCLSCENLNRDLMLTFLDFVLSLVCTAR